MRYQPKITAPGRRPSRIDAAGTWILAILVLMFSLAGCDRERQYLQQPEKSGTTGLFSAAPTDHCAGADTPDEQPHARHMASDEIAVAGTDTPEAHTLLYQAAEAAVETPPPSELPFSTGPPLPTGGRDILTRFCIARR